MPTRYTFIWWGDGYFVYDGDKYIGKDDQLSIEEMLFDSGIARRLDYEAVNSVEESADEDGIQATETLTEFFKEYGNAD